MPFVPIPTTAQVVMLFSTAGDFAENVFYVSSPEAAWTSDSLMTLANVFKTWDSAHLSTVRAAGAALTQVKCRDMTVESGPEASLIVAPSQNGTVNGGAMPDNVTLAVKWLTGVAGRSHRGRTYHVGMPKAWQDTNTDSIPGVQANLIVDAYNALITAVDATAGQILVQVSRQENKVPLSPANTHPINMAAVADLHFDSQRRRLAGHNRHR